MSTLKKIGASLSFVSLFFSFASLAFSAVDLTAIPLGDGKVSSQPKAGYVYSCQQSFNANAAGASKEGSWIHGSTWSLPEKISVMGKVIWPNANYTSSVSLGVRNITSNSLPVSSYTGTFPVASSDPAYQVDRNPNTISTQSISLALPTNPSIASTPSCVNMGMIGVALNGVAIFNALDGGGRDAVAHEVQDICGGHPEMQGEYHYHGTSTCMPHQNENNTLIGYALDGFGIYSNNDAGGKSLTNADLDQCHGITSTIMWDGKSVSMYHYVLTNEYPYTIGCFKGTPFTDKSLQGQTGNTSEVPTSHETGVAVATAVVSTLSLGSKGDDVKKVQSFLESKGYLSIPFGQSKGYFGELTRKALIKYQRENNINATGVFGTKTQLFFNRDGKDLTPKVQQEKQADTQSHISTNGSQTGSTRREHLTPPMPPKEAVDACIGKANNSACTFSAPRGESITGNCANVPNNEGSAVACIPSGGAMR